MLPCGRPEDFEGNRVNCVPKGGPRFFNVIREGGEVGEFPVQGWLKIIHSLNFFSVLSYSVAWWPSALKAFSLAENGGLSVWKWWGRDYSSIECHASPLLPSPKFNKLTDGEQFDLIFCSPSVSYLVWIQVARYVPLNVYNGRQLCISTNCSSSPILLEQTICVIEIRDSFFFSRHEQPPLWLWLCTLQCEWINILLRTPPIWFLLDRNPLRFSLHMAESVVREIQKTKRSVIVLFLIFL